MRRLLAPKWWALHLGVLVAVLVMLRLGEWQWHRATSPSGGMQNYAYAFQWPLFAVFAIVLWVRTLREEARRDAMGPAAAPQPGAPGVVQGLRSIAVPDDAEEDPELAAWNARLAALAAADAAVESRRR